MQDRVHHSRQMTIEEFLAFTDERPDDEKWELIEGVPVLNASPTYFHQIIASNICALLRNARKARRAPWQPLIGMSTRVPASPRSLPQPDVMVMEASDENLTIAENAIVLFEIMSKGNSRSDQAWRKRVYASIGKCQHYVVVDQYAARIVRYDRDTGWDGVTWRKLSEALELPALGGIALPLREIYEGTAAASRRKR